MKKLFLFIVLFCASLRVEAQLSLTAGVTYATAFNDTKTIPSVEVGMNFPIIFDGNCFATLLAKGGTTYHQLAMQRGTEALTLPYRYEIGASINPLSMLDAFSCGPIPEWAVKTEDSGFDFSNVIAISVIRKGDGGGEVKKNFTSLGLGGGVKYKFGTGRAVALSYGVSTNPNTKGGWNLGISYFHRLF